MSRRLIHFLLCFCLLVERRRLRLCVQILMNPSLRSCRLRLLRGFFHRRLLLRRLHLVLQRQFWIRLKRFLLRRSFPPQLLLWLWSFRIRLFLLLLLFRLFLGFHKRQLDQLSNPWSRIELKLHQHVSRSFCRRLLGCRLPLWHCFLFPSLHGLLRCLLLPSFLLKGCIQRCCLLHSRLCQRLWLWVVSQCLQWLRVCLLLVLQQNLMLFYFLKERTSFCSLLTHRHDKLSQWRLKSKTHVLWLQVV